MIMKARNIWSKMKKKKQKIMKKKLRIMHKNLQDVKQKYKKMRMINYEVENDKEDEESRRNRI